MNLSLYNDEPLDLTTFAAGEKFLMKRFPNFDKFLGTLLFKSLIDKGFTKQRFKDAIKFVFENYEYNNFIPASILNFDKVLEMKTNLEILELSKSFGDSIWKHYQAVDINGTCLFVEKDKMKQYNITLPIWDGTKYRPTEPLTEKQIEEIQERFDFKKTIEEIENKTKKKPLKRTELQGKRMTAEEIIAEAEKRRKDNGIL